jgi:hypothetical protein
LNVRLHDEAPTIARLLSRLRRSQIELLIGKYLLQLIQAGFVEHDLDSPVLMGCPQGVIDGSSNTSQSIHTLVSSTRRIDFKTSRSRAGNAIVRAAARLAPRGRFERA